MITNSRPRSWRRPAPASAPRRRRPRPPLGEHKPGRIKPGRTKRAALSLQNQYHYSCCFLIRPRLYASDSSPSCASMARTASHCSMLRSERSLAKEARTQIACVCVLCLFVVYCYNVMFLISCCASVVRTSTLPTR